MVDRRNATHGFRMAEAQVASWRQRVVKGLRGGFARQLIEIDQEVATEDDVEIPVATGIRACLRRMSSRLVGGLSKLGSVVSHPTHPTANPAGPEEDHLVRGDRQPSRRLPGSQHRVGVDGGEQLGIACSFI